MRNQIRNDEDYKREVLDLYSHINMMCQDNININAMLAAFDDASSCIERLKVFRISQMASNLNY